MVQRFYAFSIKSLLVATAIGCMTALIGFLYDIYTVIKNFVVPEFVSVCDQRMHRTLRAGTATVPLHIQGFAGMDSGKVSWLDKTYRKLSLEISLEKPSVYSMLQSPGGIF